MAGVNVDTRTILMVVLVVFVLIGGLYLLNPAYVTHMFGGREGFEDAPDSDKVLSEKANFKRTNAASDVNGMEQMDANLENPNVARAPDSETSTAPNMNAPETILPPSVSGFADLSDFEGPAQFGNAQPPAGCYPRDQLTPSELLPKDPNSVWAQQNPMGTGSLKGKNFLSAGALIGVNTVGQSLRNANYQLRSEPPNPQVPVSVFNQTTIEPDVNRRTLEIA
jgi:hypothetical protein